MTKGKLQAILPYMGGKRSLAPAIVRELGEHRAYLEPFCGSLAVLLAKPPCGHEYVNDLNGDVINLARVLASPDWRELANRLDRTLCSEDLFDQAKSEILTDAWELPDPYDIERAYRYFVYSWLGRNGFAGTQGASGFSVRYTANGGSQSVRFRSAVTSIPAWHARMRLVSILRRDALEVIARSHDAEGHVIYADPPYFPSTRTTKSSTFGKYHHELTDDQHRELASLLKRFTKTRIVLSYYESPLLEELYSGWTMRRFSMTKNLASQNARGKANTTKSPEVLLINGPSFSNVELF